MSDDVDDVVDLVARIRGPRPSITLPCADNQDLYFSLEADDVAAAKRLCAGCPVLDRCAERAERWRPVGGVWAGVEWGKDRRPVEDRRTA